MSTSEALEVSLRENFIPQPSLITLLILKCCFQAHGQLCRLHFGVRMAGTECSRQALCWRDIF